MLGRWVTKTRTRYRKGQLPPEEISRLNKLGFDWEPDKNVWDIRFAELVGFKKEHGHCNVPVEKSVLGKWVAHQRDERKIGRLSADRIKRLDSMGFDWDPINSRWEARFAQLKFYKERHGHCSVPGKAENGLGFWVSNQRQYRKKAMLSDERIRLLDSIGFEWEQKADALGASWEARFAELKAFKKEHGHCNVPKSSSGLGLWVQAQRRKYGKGELSKDYVRRLEEIGFVWNTKIKY